MLAVLLARLPLAAAGADTDADRPASTWLTGVFCAVNGAGFDVGSAGPCVSREITEAKPPTTRHATKAATSLLTRPKRGMERS